MRLDDQGSVFKTLEVGLDVFVVKMIVAEDAFLHVAQTVDAAGDVRRLGCLDALAARGDEIDARFGQIDGLIAVIGDDQADGQEPRMWIIDAKKRVFVARPKNVGRDSEMFRAVRLVTRIFTRPHRRRGDVVGGACEDADSQQESDGRSFHAVDDYHLRCKQRQRESAAIAEDATETMWVYSVALCAVLIGGLPFWILRMITRGKYRAGLAERFGWVPARLTRTCGIGKRSLWIHAVSVGEVIAVLPLAARMAEEHPELCILLSTTTQTGQQIARERWGAERVFYFPLDFRWIVRRYLRALRPEMVVLAETELWPNFIASAASARVPIAVVNARISDRSYPRYRRLRWFWRGQLQRIRLYCAQTEEDAGRLREIGAPAERVRITGNLKFDVSPPRGGAMVEQLRQRFADAKVLVAGSTVDDEEKLLLDLWIEMSRKVQGLWMVLAPRRPERFDAVAAMLAASGIPFTRRSQWRGEPLDGDRRVFLLDSIGELAGFYSLATVAFVGGSVAAGGGHNPLEPAQWGVPVVMGESYENFRGIVDAMREADAIRIVPREKLSEELVRLLNDEQAARALGERARTVARAQAGALERTVAALNGLLAERTQ